MTVFTNELKCIKVTHTYEGETMTNYISYNQFKASFIDERWQGERRYNREYTIFGYVHTKTIVKSPTGSKSVRVFDFPNSVNEAETIHQQQTDKE